MAKSSSSSRKKRSKHSSLERARKKSKTKRAKAKKIRRYDDSDSYSSDNSSSASISSSSEDSYRGRKSRSLTRKDSKGTKRRGHSHSSSSEESKRTRKGSKRKVDSDVRKKPLKHKKKKMMKKKKSRRDDSRSCESASDSSDESEYERHTRGRSKRRERSLKSAKNVKSRSKKRRYRSTSCSSGSRDSSSDYLREEKVTDGGISKRLKSVITFAKDEMEEKELDEHKEEIIYEDDGYPSSRSNDSFDGGSNKRISGNQSPLNRSTENEKKEEPFDIKTTQLSGRCLGGGDDQPVEEKDAPDGFGTIDSLEEKTDEIAKTDDLETILREKALENLKKFRGINARSNANKKDESPRKAGLSGSDPKDDCPREVKEDSAVDYLEEEKIIDEKNGGSGSAFVETNKSTNLNRGVNKQRLVTRALKQALSNCTNSAVETPKVKLVNETCVGGKEEAALNTLQDHDEEKRLQVGDSDTLNNPCGSTGSGAQDINSSEGQVEGSGSGSGSQLERKTMSVMRGGEMVQVSYKVYIPKKTPALARRQLNR